MHLFFRIRKLIHLGRESTMCLYMLDIDVSSLKWTFAGNSNLYFAFLEVPVCYPEDLF